MAELYPYCIIHKAGLMYKMWYVAVNELVLELTLSLSLDIWYRERHPGPQELQPTK